MHFFTSSPSSIVAYTFQKLMNHIPYVSTIHLHDPLMSNCSNHLNLLFNYQRHGQELDSTDRGLDSFTYYSPSHTFLFHISLSTFCSSVNDISIISIHFIPSLLIWNSLELNYYNLSTSSILVALQILQNHQHLPHIPQWLQNTLHHCNTDFVVKTVLAPHWQTICVTKHHSLTIFNHHNIGLIIKSIANAATAV